MDRSTRTITLVVPPDLPHVAPPLPSFDATATEASHASTTAGRSASDFASGTSAGSASSTIPVGKPPLAPRRPTSVNPLLNKRRAPRTSSTPARAPTKGPVSVRVAFTPTDDTSSLSTPWIRERVAKLEAALRTLTPGTVAHERLQAQHDRLAEALARRT